MLSLKKIAIIGSGDLGQHIAHYLLSDNYASSIVFYDDYAEKGSQKGFGIVQGIVNQAATDFNSGLYDEMFLAIGYNHFSVRQRLFEELSNTIKFGTFVHSRSFVDSSVVLKAGTVILPSCTLDKSVSISENVFLNVGCTIAHDSTIGAHSFFGPGVTLAGVCSIGKCCFVGTGTIVIDNITIIDGVQTGGGTVVIQNLMETGLYVGVPAKKIK